MKKKAAKKKATKRKALRKDYKGNNIYLTERERRTPIAQLKVWKAPKDMPDEQVRMVVSGRMCGAKLKSWNTNQKKSANKYCTKRPIPGVNLPYRCKGHNGANPGGPIGNQKARKHGLYSCALLAGEEEEYERLSEESETDFNHEIAITKLRLRRAMKAEADMVRKREEGEIITEAELELISKETKTGQNDQGGYADVKVVRQIPNYKRQIHEIVTQLVKLEQTRIISQQGDSGKMSPSDKAAKAREFLKAAQDSIA